MGQRLFAAHTRPFERRIVIVPSSAQKEFLADFFASHPRYQVFAGVQVMTLSQGFLELLSLLSQEKQERIPSLLELSLHIEEVICQAFSAPVQKEVLHPLFDYVGVDLEKQDRRIGSLSVQLANLFSRYGLYGAAFLEEWMKKNGWQQWLWKKIFVDASGWTYPIKALDKAVSCPFQVHLFGFHTMPMVYQQFFHKLNTAFYVLSPCSMFWEDLASDRERIGARRHFEKRKFRQSDVEQWDLYLRDTNPLLSNWGKVGREFIKQLEGGDVLSGEAYIEPERKTLLAEVQRDLLHLRNPQETGPKVAAEGDCSIQVHSAVSHLREVEVLYEQVCGISLMPREILVLSSDLDLYAPFIQTVFGSKESKLSYSIEGVSASSGSEIFEGVLHLLSLPAAQFSSDALLKLFSMPSFLEKWTFSREDAATLRRWIKLANIRWGLHGSNPGTWEHGLDRLLLGLTMAIDEEKALEVEGSLWPCAGVNATDLDLLTKLIALIHSLEEDLKPIVHRQKKSLAGWLDFAERLIAHYFELSVDNIGTEMQKLRSSFSSHEDPVLSCETLIRMMKSLAEAQSATLSSPNRQKIAFRPLRNGNITPAKAIWLLGMDESSFPCNATESSLCEMQACKEKEYIPKPAEEDRYLFLECVMSAKEHLILSYQRTDPKDNKEQSLSVVVQELLHYLGAAFSGITHHPAFPFDRRYYSQHSPLLSHSEKQYRCAHFNYCEKRPPSPFFVQGTHRDSEHLRVVDVKALFDLAKHPIRFHFQQALQIYMRSEDDENRDFILSPLLKAIFRKKVMKQSLKAQLKVWKAQGKLPVGVFGEVAIDAIEEEALDLKEHLETFKVSVDQIFSLELSQLCTQPIEQAQGHWIYPALRVPMRDGTEAILTGKIDNLTPRGLLFHGEDKLEDWIKAWPQLLVIGTLKCAEPRLLLTKSGKERQGQFSDYYSLLQDYLEYHVRSLEQLSPLMPEWTPSLLFKTPLELEKAISQSLNNSGFDDEYLLWLKRRGALPDPKEAFDTWSDYASKLYQPMLQAWKKEGSDAAL